MPKPPISEDFQVLVFHAQQNELEELAKAHALERAKAAALRKLQNPETITASDMAGGKSPEERKAELYSEIARIDKEAEAAAHAAEESTDVVPGSRFPAPSITVK